MSEMVERVARAIEDAAGLQNLTFIYQHLGFNPEKIARAVIAALREPTKSMDGKAFAKLKEIGAYPVAGKPRGCNLFAEDMADLWRVMIDEALAGPAQGIDEALREPAKTIDEALQ